MKTPLFIFVLFLFLSSCTSTVYIVRHAEKAAPSGEGMMRTDPPLTEEGKQRAEALKQELQSQQIAYIFSTNTQRTRATAEPIRAFFDLTTEIYAPAPDPVFINRLRSLKKNALVVGHSNTVDDIVNQLCGKVKIPADLADTEYDNLFVVKKKGKRTIFERRKYGKPSP